MRTIVLFGVAYALCFWGSTLLIGGKDPRTGATTGSWPFMYAMLGLGKGPQIVSAGAFTGTPNPGTSFTASKEL